MGVQCNLGLLAGRNRISLYYTTFCMGFRNSYIVFFDGGVQYILGLLSGEPESAGYTNLYGVPKFLVVLKGGATYPRIIGRGCQKFYRDEGCQFS